MHRAAPSTLLTVSAAAPLAPQRVPLRPEATYSIVARLPDDPALVDRLVQGMRGGRR